MAITYPLASADFWEQLRFIDRPVFVPQHNRRQSMSGGGDVLSSMMGQPKWLINMTLSGGRFHRNMHSEADLMQLNSRDGTILAYDIRVPFPADDMSGWKLNGRTITVKTKGSNNRSISLEGLRPDFIVNKKDKYCIPYDTDKYFLFEVLETVQADGSGDTDEFEIWPFMPPGVSAGDAVIMRKAPGKFKLAGSGFRPSGGSGNMASGFSFSLISVP